MDSPKGARLRPPTDRRPLVIGHRGFPGQSPDNSLAGVAAALEVGADGVEVDVRRSVDGVWVCHHDRSRAGRPLDRWALEELEREGVPSLVAVVDAVPPGRWLFVEIKPLSRGSLRAGMAALVSAVQRRPARTRVISSSLAVLAAVGEALPSVPRSWVVDTAPPRRPPAGVALSPRHTLVEELIPLGIPLHPWAPDARRRLARLVELGVASVTTNRPDVAREVVDG